MADGPSRIAILPDHFSVSSPPAAAPDENSSSPSPSTPHSSWRFHSQSRARRKLRKAALMLNLLTLKRLSWGSTGSGQEKIELSVAELESLKSELADLEEREAYLKAQLEHVDEVLRSARLSGYLLIRTRWTALPGEPPPIDDTEVDDWLPRFVVLQGPCIFFFLMSTDLSPQDSTLLSDVVEADSLPCYSRESETYYCFYILTCQGLRFECSSTSKVQVDSWLSALHSHCKLEDESEAAKLPNGSSDM